MLALDEPSAGLSPKLVETVMLKLREVRASGVAVLLVEQNAHHALRLAHRGYVLQNGKIVLEGTGRALLANREVRAAYLGG